MSSDTTTQDGEDRRLPATWEAYQRERRAVFEDAVMWARARASAPDVGSTYAEARRRYPITKRVPRVVELSERVRAHVVGGNVCFQTHDGVYRFDTAAYFLTPDNVAALADLLANPFEEISE